MAALATGWADWRAGGSRIAVPGTPHALFVRQDGPRAGRPVTLLHGFPTSSHDWVFVMPYLVRAGFRVTTIDMLGFGDSDKPARHPYSILGQADLVEGVWRALGTGETALVAHDVGTTVAQEILARDPRRITAMTWLNGGLYPDLHRPLRTQLALRGRLGPVLARLVTEWRFVAALRSTFGRPVADEVLHDMWLAVSHRGGRRLAPRLLRYIDERRQHAARWAGALEGFAGPTQFVWGPEDPISGAHVLPRIRERMPRAEVVVLDGPQPVGHYPQVEAPELVGPVLASFLSAGRARL